MEQNTTHLPNFPGLGFLNSEVSSLRSIVTLLEEREAAINDTCICGDATIPVAGQTHSNGEPITWDCYMRNWDDRPSIDMYLGQDKTHDLTVNGIQYCHVKATVTILKMDGDNPTYHYTISARRVSTWDTTLTESAYKKIKEFALDSVSEAVSMFFKTKVMADAKDAWKAKEARQRITKAKDELLGAIKMLETQAREFSR